MGCQTPLTKSLHMAFSVFNNQDLEEHQNIKIIIISIATGNALNSHNPSKGKTEMIKSSNSRYLACNYTKILPGPCSKCEAVNVLDSWHWLIHGWLFCSQSKAIATKTVICNSEETKGTLQCSCSGSSPFPVSNAGYDGWVNAITSLCSDLILGKAYCKAI